MVETWWPAGVVRVHANLDPFSAKFSLRSAIQSLPRFSSVFSFAASPIHPPRSILFLPICFFRSSLFPVVSCYLFTGLRSGRSANWPCDSSRYSNTASSLKAQGKGEKRKENSDRTSSNRLCDNDFFYGLCELCREKIGFNNWKAILCFNPWRIFECRSIYLHESVIGTFSEKIYHF